MTKMPWKWRRFNCCVSSFSIFCDISIVISAVANMHYRWKEVCLAAVGLVKVRPPFQYRIRSLLGKSREVSSVRDMCFEFLNCSGSWQPSRQHCCRAACQISRSREHIDTESRRFDTLRDLTIRYWNGSLHVFDIWSLLWLSFSLMSTHIVRH